MLMMYSELEVVCDFVRHELAVNLDHDIFLEQQLWKAYAYFIFIDGCIYAIYS